LTKPARDELSQTLQDLRVDAGLSQTDAAHRAGVSQATISRFETGKQMPTEPEIERLCQIYSAPARTRRGLVSLARTIRQGTSKARTVLQRHDAPRLQARIALIERASARIRGLQTAIIWGLLQTHDYASGIAARSFTGEDAEQFVAKRMERRQALDSDRQFTVVQTEGSLRWHIGSPTVMADQMDQLISDSRRTNMRLGVIPWTRPVHGAILHGFQIFDSRAVMVGTEAATALITDPPDVRHYEQRFARYEALAVYDDEARAVFKRIADEYRALDEL
jgi:transcriptional regulator with XRE-family HTH domain